MSFRRHEQNPVWQEILLHTLIFQEKGMHFEEARRAAVIETEAIMRRSVEIRAAKRRLDAKIAKIRKAEAA